MGDSDWSGDDNVNGEGEGPLHTPRKDCASVDSTRSRGRSSAASSECFVAGCSVKKVGTKKFCSRHKRDAEAMQHQAKKAGEEEACKNLWICPHRARLALEQFDRDNPQGRFRKNLIDWAQYKRSYISGSSFTEREEEEEWQFQDWVDKKHSEGSFDEAANTTEWCALVDATAPDRKSGDGVGASIWRRVRRKRIRDTTKRIEHSYSEGSQAVKNLKTGDRDKLLEFTKAQANSSSHSWLTSASYVPVGGSSGAERQDDNDKSEDDDDQNTALAKPKRQRIDLGTAIPDMIRVQIDAWVALKNKMAITARQGSEVLTQADKFLGDKCVTFAAHMKTCQFRRASVLAWCAHDAASMRQAIDLFKEYGMGEVVTFAEEQMRVMSEQPLIAPAAISHGAGGAARQTEPQVVGASAG